MDGFNCWEKREQSELAAQQKVNYNYEILNPTIDDYKDLKVWSKAWPYIVTWRGPLAKRQRCIVIQDKERGWGTEQKGADSIQRTM